MLKMAGACLIVLGAIGTGSCICLEKKRRIRQLLALGQAFLAISGEISYSRAGLPEIFLEASGRMAEGETAAIAQAFGRVGQRLFDGNGALFERVWEEEMEAFFAAGNPGIEEKKLLRSFPLCVWYLDGERQQEAVGEFAGKLLACAQRLSKEEAEQEKLVMACSAVCGLLVAILLL